MCGHNTTCHHLFVLNWSCGISGVWCVSVRLCTLTCTQMYAALPTFGVQCVLCWLKILNSAPFRRTIKRTLWCCSSHNKTNKHTHTHTHYVRPTNKHTHTSHLFITHYLKIPNIFLSYPTMMATAVETCWCANNKRYTRVTRVQMFVLCELKYHL
jgi:hypothetical protein